MDSERKIVVGIDGSQHAIRALREGARLATALGARLALVSAWQFPAVGTGAYPLDPGLFEQSAKENLQTAVKTVFGDQVPPDLTTELRSGPPARVLIDASKDAELLVVGSRGHGGFAGLLLGSVSMACAEHADCPVLVMHPRV